MWADTSQRAAYCSNDLRWRLLLTDIQWPDIFMTINHHSLILKQTVQFILILLLGYFFIDFLDYKYFAIHLRYIPDVSTMTWPRCSIGGLNTTFTQAVSHSASFPDVVCSLRYPSASELCQTFCLVWNSLTAGIRGSSTVWAVVRTRGAFCWISHVGQPEKVWIKHWLWNNPHIHINTGLKW